MGRRLGQNRASQWLKSPYSTYQTGGEGKLKAPEEVQFPELGQCELVDPPDVSPETAVCESRLQNNVFN